MPLTARTTDSTTAHSPCAHGQCSAGSNNVFYKQFACIQSYR